MKITPHSCSELIRLTKTKPTSWKNTNSETPIPKASSMTYIAFIFQVHKIYAIEKTMNGQAKRTGVSRWLQDNGNSRLFTKASLVVCEQAPADRGGGRELTSRAWHQSRRQPPWILVIIRKTRFHIFVVIAAYIGTATQRSRLVAMTWRCRSIRTPARRIIGTTRIFSKLSAMRE